METSAPAPESTLVLEATEGEEQELDHNDLTDLSQISEPDADDKDTLGPQMKAPRAHAISKAQMKEKPTDDVDSTEKGNPYTAKTPEKATNSTAKAKATSSETSKEKSTEKTKPAEKATAQNETSSAPANKTAEPTATA